jgi:hypothetical protein
MRQACRVPPPDVAPLNGERGVLVVGFGLQPSHNRELPIEVPATDAQPTCDCGVPATGVDDPIAINLTAVKAEPPIARTVKGKKTCRLA